MGTQPAPEKWVTKKVAAELLKIGEREIERMAVQDAAVAAAVRAVQEERAAGIRLSAPQTPHNALAVVGISQAQSRVADAQVAALSGLAEHFAKLSAIFPPPLTRKAWLSFPEAIEHSGLLPSTLADLLRREIVYATGRGPKTWRIQRVSLDAYGEAPKQ